VKEEGRLVRCTAQEGAIVSSVLYWAQQLGALVTPGLARHRVWRSERHGRKQPFLTQQHNIARAIPRSVWVLRGLGVELFATFVIEISRKC